jgi:hypothetical protein
VATLSHTWCRLASIKLAGKNPLYKSQQGSHVFLVKIFTSILLGSSRSQVAAEVLLTVSKMITPCSPQSYRRGKRLDEYGSKQLYIHFNRETTISLSGIPMLSFARSKMSSLKLQRKSLGTMTWHPKWLTTYELRVEELTLTTRPFLLHVIQQLCIVYQECRVLSQTYTAPLRPVKQHKPELWLLYAHPKTWKSDPRNLLHNTFCIHRTISQNIWDKH